MADNKCSQCGAAIAAKAKFCPSCGRKVEMQASEPAVTLATLTEHFDERGEKLDSGVFKLLVPTLDDRSQLVFALPIQDADGDEELNDLQLWSNFAPVKKVNVKRVLEFTEAISFGFCQLGDFYCLATSIRPWQLRSVDALVWHVTRLAIIADQLESDLLGSDDL